MTTDQVENMNSESKTAKDPPENSSQTATRWQQLRQKRWFRWGTDIAILLAIFTAITLWQGRNLIGSGEPAPDFALTDMQNVEHQLADYEGKKTFIVFWAPWCPICGAESDNITRVKSWMGDRINVISVVLDYQGPDDIQKFIDKHDVDYPVLKGTRQVGSDYQISAYPTMYVLDKDGKIAHTVPGYTTTLGMLWRALF